MWLSRSGSPVRPGRHRRRNRHRRLDQPDVARLHQVDEVCIPEFHLSDPPFPDQRMLADVGHRVAPSDLGNRDEGGRRTGRRGELIGIGAPV